MAGEPNIVQGATIVTMGGGQSQGGADFDPMKLAMTIQALKHQKTQDALSTLQQMMQMAQAGVPVDPSQMEKVAKDAGIVTPTGKGGGKQDKTGVLPPGTSSGGGPPPSPLGTSPTGQGDQAGIQALGMDIPGTLAA